MFQVPRDMVDVPVPANARSVWGSVYRGKINSWFTANRGRTDLWPGKTGSARGFNSLKALLGELYGLDIRYYALVNFQGFRQVVNAMGGVQINVQIPVAESQFPTSEGRLTRIYIPAGPQHMTGTEALRYARSRHRAAGGDFDRGRRQQRVLLSLREQMNAQAIIANLPELVGALKDSVKTDIKTQDLPKLLALAEGVDTKNIRSFVFAPILLRQRGPELVARLHHHAQRRADPEGGRPGVQDHAGAARPPRAPGVGGRDRLGPQRIGTRRAGDVVGRVPRVPGAQRLRPAAVARRAPLEDEDRRLQRRGDGPARDDQVPRAPVRHDGHDRHGSGSRRGHRDHARQGRPEPGRRRRRLTAVGPRAGCGQARDGRSRGQPSTGVSQLRYSSRFPRTAAK